MQKPLAIASRSEIAGQQLRGPAERRLGEAFGDVDENIGSARQLESHDTRDLSAEEARSRVSTLVVESRNGDAFHVAPGWLRRAPASGGGQQQAKEREG